jgi:hypothetical protein
MNSNCILQAGKGRTEKNNRESERWKREFTRTAEPRYFPDGVRRPSFLSAPRGASRRFTGMKDADFPAPARDAS